MQLIGPVLFIDTWLDLPVVIAWIITGLCVAALSRVVFRLLRRFLWVG